MPVRRFAELEQSEFDLLVVGGGIVGCGIARDAALRGLHVALFEKEDFCCGTSARSTRLIHGGLRYLEILDFGLVRQDLREREILLKTAPHRVQPLGFLIPLFDRSPADRLLLRLGMLLYDLLSYDKSLPSGRFLSAAETLRLEPHLRAEGLQGAAFYYDAQAAFVERLGLDNVLDAERHGARIYNYACVRDLLRGPGPGRRDQVVGVRVRDTLTGEEASVRGRIVVNAVGPWFDRVGAAWTGRPSHRLRLTRGAHFAAPRSVRHAVVLFAPEDGRLMFVIPWRGLSWVGTTDIDFSGDPDTVCATDAEINYLLESVAHAFPAVDWKQIFFTQAGVRALVRDGRPGRAESAVSRRHRVVYHTEEEGLEGMISVLGGKITAYRGVAEEVVDGVCRSLARREAARTHGARGPCRTHTRPLPGGEQADGARLLRDARRDAGLVGLDAGQADHLVFLYGAAYPEILKRIHADPALAERIAWNQPDIRAQIAHAVAAEHVRTACDFLLRRSALGFTPSQGQEALEVVLQELSCRLGWSAERRAREAADYRAHCALASWSASASGLDRSAR